MAIKKRRFSQSKNRGSAIEKGSKYICFLNKSFMVLPNTSRYLSISLFFCLGKLVISILAIDFLCNFNITLKSCLTKFGDFSGNFFIMLWSCPMQLGVFLQNFGMTSLTFLIELSVSFGNSDITFQFYPIQLRYFPITLV